MEMAPCMERLVFQPRGGGGTACPILLLSWLLIEESERIDRGSNRIEVRLRWPVNAADAIRERMCVVNMEARHGKWIRMDK